MTFAPRNDSFKQKLIKNKEFENFEKMVILASIFASNTIFVEYSTRPVEISDVPDVKNEKFMKSRCVLHRESSFLNKNSQF